MQFFDLPAELRNQIYELVFEHSPDETNVLPVPSHYQPSTIASRRYFSLLSANRQLRAEALPFFYSQVIFEADDIQHALEWLPTLTDLQIKSIRQLQIHYVFFTGSGPDWVQLDQDDMDGIEAKLQKRLVREARMLLEGDAVRAVRPLDEGLNSETGVLSKEAQDFVDCEYA